MPRVQHHTLCFIATKLPVPISPCINRSELLKSSNLHSKEPSRSIQPLLRPIISIKESIERAKSSSQYSYRKVNLHAPPQLPKNHHEPPTSLTEDRLVHLGDDAYPKPSKLVFQGCCACEQDLTRLSSISTPKFPLTNPHKNLKDVLRSRSEKGPFADCRRGKPRSQSSTTAREQTASTSPTAFISEQAY
jgi:hypothetical protein